MTVQTSSRRIVYSGDGTSLVFQVPFRFLTNAEVRIILATAAGVETVQTLNIDYTLTGADQPSGGTATFIVAPPVSSRVVIKRQTAQVQPLDFTPFDPFPAEAQERALDRGILIDQELGDNIGRAIIVPETDPLLGQMILPAASVRANKMLAFDSNGALAATIDAAAVATLISAAINPSLTQLAQNILYLAPYTGAVGRSLQAKLAETASITDLGADATGAASVATPLTNLFNAGNAFAIPDGTFNLGSTVALSGKPFSWRKSAGATFTGAATIDTATDLSGFNFTADLRNINLVETRGTTAAPVTDVQPPALFSKHSNVSLAANFQNASLVAQHYKWNTTAFTVGQAFFAEAIDRGGNGAGRTDFVEGIRAHGLGMGAATYGGIFYAQLGDGVSVPAGKIALGCESEVARVLGPNAVDPVSWTSANNLDGSFIATVRNGVRPMAGYIVNPYNSVSFRCGFAVMNSFAATGSITPVVNFASFFTNETNVPYGLFIRNTSFAAISLPNNSQIVAANAADSAELNILYLDTNDALHLGQSATSIILHGKTTFVPPTSATPDLNGDMVIQRTSNTSLTFRLKGTDGTVRQGSLTLA